MLIDSGRSSIGVEQLLETESIEYPSFARRGGWRRRSKTPCEYRKRCRFSIVSSASGTVGHIY